MDSKLNWKRNLDLCAHVCWYKLQKREAVFWTSCKCVSEAKLIPIKTELK